MAPHVSPRSSTYILPLCSFLYPPSCFAKSTISFAPRAAIKARAAGVHSISRQCGRLSNGKTIQSWSSAPLSQVRTFSASTHSLRSLDPMAGLKRPPMRFESVKNTTQKQLAKTGMPEDIGLFENTLIMPTGDAKPSLFRQPTLRLKLEYFRLKSRVWDFIRVVVFKFSMGKPRPKLLLRQTGQIARRLHEEMYQSFAKGDLSRLQSICANGLQSQFARRLSQRNPNEKYEWTAHRYIGRPRVVSHKASLVPFGEQNVGQRQAVVKIVSEQSLTTVDAKTGVPVLGERRKTERKVEYLVVQQRFSQEGGGAEPWKIWGTLQEKGWMELLQKAGLI